MGGLEKFLFHPIVLAAFGTAMAVGLLVIGITFLLFKFLQKRLSKGSWEPIQSQMSESGELYHNTLPIKCPWPCNEHKSLVDKLGGLDSGLDDVEGRQKSLREDVLPDKYVSRRDHEACQKDRKSHETELFGRVGVLEQRMGVK